MVVVWRTNSKIVGNVFVVNDIVRSVLMGNVWWEMFWWEMSVSRIKNTQNVFFWIRISDFTLQMKDTTGFLLYTHIWRMKTKKKHICFKMLFVTL